MTKGGRWGISSSMGISSTFNVSAFQYYCNSVFLLSILLAPELIVVEPLVRIAVQYFSKAVGVGLSQRGGPDFCAFAFYLVREAEFVHIDMVGVDVLLHDEGAKGRHITCGGQDVGSHRQVCLSAEYFATNGLLRTEDTVAVHRNDLALCKGIVHLEHVIHSAVGEDEPQVLVLEHAVAVLHHRACLATEHEGIDCLLVLRKHIARQLEVADVSANLHETAGLIAKRHEAFVAFNDQLEACPAVEGKAVQNDLTEAEVVGIDIKE